MRRRIAVVLALAGAGMTAVSFFIPADFAWNGLDTLKSCVATSHYASGTAARLVWLGFAAAVLFPYVWAAAAGIAMAAEWRAPSRVAPYIPAAVTTVGGLLAGILGVSLILMCEAWPEPAVQWTAAVGAIAHVAVLWMVAVRVSYPRRTAVTILVGGVPFLALQVCLGVASRQYGSDVVGFVLGAAGMLAILAASVVLMLAAVCESAGHGGED